MSMVPKITIKVDKKDPGLATGEAVWPETGVSVLPCAVRLEQWSDGKWRAMGMQEPADTPEKAMKMLLFARLASQGQL
jgi:hypothetical protein